MKNYDNSRPLLSRPSLASDIARELAERNLRDFVRLAWPVVEPSTPFVEGWHIDAITDHLQAITRGEIRNLLINVPPRHMKSLLVSVFWPCWEWLRHPERRWLFSSYGASLSIRDSIRCRRLIESPWYRGNWGDRFSLAGDQNAKARFENDRTGYRLATSVGGAATGEGGDRVVCDDPHNVQEAESDVVRKATLDWWDVVMSTRLNDPRTAAKVIVMQRCHERDLSGHVLEQGGWEHLCLPAEYDGAVWKSSIGWTDPRRRADELLWPGRFGIPEIADLKRCLGGYAAAGQLQQRPSPAEGGILKRHWWRYWEPARSATAGVTPLPQRFDAVVISCDCSFKDLKNSDFVALQAWGRLGANKFLLDRVKERMDYVATEIAFERFCLKWPAARAKYVEEKANGAALISRMRSRIPGIIPVNPTDGKIARVYAETPDIEAGNVFLPHPSGAPWVNEFIEQCAAFPNGAHDDEVDAMTQALAKLRKSSSPAFLQTSAGY